MHNNYYFLRQLSKQLREEFNSYKIGEVFSQAKNELIISLFHKGAELTVKAHLSPEFCCLSFMENFTRARRNSIDLFPELYGREIIDIVQVEQDRSFYFQLEDGMRLLFKMHGNRSNIVLIQEDKVLNIFKKNLKQDYSISIEGLSNKIDMRREAFENVHGDYKQLVPTFGKSFDRYFAAKNYMLLDIDEKYRCFVSLIDYLEQPGFFIHEDEKGLPVFSLYQISTSDQCLLKPMEAVSVFFRKYIAAFRLSKEKAIVRQSLLTQIRKGEAYILKSSSKLNKLMSASNYKQKGDLIMANLHIIDMHAKEVELIDFYSHKPVIVKLKPGITPQLNAEKYYRKSKKQQIEFNTLTDNIASRKQQVLELKTQLSDLDTVTQLKQLGKKIKNKPLPQDQVYHLVSYKGYELLIGKNAQKNEQLTFKVAKKEDIFLHAKDTPGSHVIIKKKSNQNIPNAVLEKAASFAAYYSKNKSEALCRVLYTPRKYVRKAKGAPAGAVIVERENVILVKPENIGS